MLPAAASTAAGSRRVVTAVVQITDGVAGLAQSGLNLLFLLPKQVIDSLEIPCGLCVRRLELLLRDLTQQKLPAKTSRDPRNEVERWAQYRAAVSMQLSARARLCWTGRPRDTRLCEEWSF